MELIERAGLLSSLKKRFQGVEKEEGHCVFLCGEAGIGKTSIVKAFLKESGINCNIYQGTCDALFTPRPLAPLYDVIMQMHGELPEHGSDITDRTAFFTKFFYELSNQKKTTLIIFEDIHWADEATLDFIKFFARRITQIPCLFLLTYRDDEIHSRHPLRNVFGQLNAGSFTRIQLNPLSKEAVAKWAAERGYNGEDVYTISGGNPFYVNEILASYSPGIPDNIKDSILAVYYRHDQSTQEVWRILSVVPTGLETRYIEKMAPFYGDAIENCIQAKIVELDRGVMSFRHELYRRTVEVSLSPLVRVALNKRILELFKEGFEADEQIERIIHHAKNANEYDLIVHYAPLAAKQAAAVGAHVEASKLYFTAIEYYQGNDKDLLLNFYESYAYECYLTNQVKEAIIYTSKSLNIWKEKNDIEKIGNSLRFLSRLWWFDGERKQAENFAKQAVDVLETQPSSRARAMAYSNMSQLKMLSYEVDDCIYWGEKAIAISKELNDEEVLSHALNNVGNVKIKEPSLREEGFGQLQQSLELALKNSYHEHIARAYTNQSYSSLILKNYSLSNEALEKGLAYCEERDLDSWLSYMMTIKARLKLETGSWKEAHCIANDLLKNENQAGVVKIGALVVAGIIRARRGNGDALPLLQEARARAFETMELLRIIPTLSALLEYEWIIGETCIESSILNQSIDMVESSGNLFEDSEFAFWLWKARKKKAIIKQTYPAYDISSKDAALKSAAIWEKVGCPYEQALTLFEGGEEEKRQAIAMIQALGATSVYEKLKMDMRSSGIKNIPRGIRKSTQSNPALLTARELDVLKLLQEGLQNKEIAAKLFISAKTVDHHISSILFKLDSNSRVKAVQQATKLGILK
jgi:DNA-binding CsgD family transcriptional regulator